LKPGKWVFVPTDQSIADGEAVKKSINKRWRPPSNYFHLRSGGHVRALERHRHNSVFAQLDIKDFFGSINKTRVTRCLKGLFNYSESREIAAASTVLYPGEKHFILPFGFVQSPILASLCLAKSGLGKCIHSLPHRYPGLVVSVYVDDIVLSNDDADELTKAIAELKHFAQLSRFELNEQKEEKPAPQITAFNIQLSHASMEISADRYASFLDAFRNSESQAQRAGILSYVQSVNSVQAFRMGPI
jgi:hypothetical protein